MSHNKYFTPDGLWGAAIRYTRIDEEGKMWIGNGEYESQVNYCPITGEPAPVQMKLVETTHTYNNGTTEIFKEYINEQNRPTQTTNQ